MTPKEYADKLVSEYEEILRNEITSGMDISIGSAAIKCAIKQLEAEKDLNIVFLDEVEIQTLTESITYLKSLL